MFVDKREGGHYENLTMQYTETFFSSKIEKSIRKIKIFLTVLLKKLIVGTQ